MTRTDSGLTATTDERRRFRMLIRLAKAGFGGQTPRTLIRAGGSIERPAFTAELERLTETGIIEPIVDGVERYRLTETAAEAMTLLFPEAARFEYPGQVVIRPPSEFVWQPDPESLRDPEAGPGPIVDDGQPMTQDEIDHMRYQPSDSSPEKSWWDMLSDELGELAPAGFWS